MASGSIFSKRLMLHLFTGSLYLLRAAALQLQSPLHDHDVAPYQCSTDAHICNADCLAASAVVCAQDFHTVPRVNATVGNCTATWVNPYTAQGAVVPPDFNFPNISTATCLELFDRALGPSMNQSDCAAHRYFGSTVLVYTSPTDRDPGSSYMVSMEPPKAEPCCYGQKDCDPNKIFGQELTCSTQNDNVVTRRRENGMQIYSPSTSVDIARRKLSPACISLVAVTGVGLGACLALVISVYVFGPFPVQISRLIRWSSLVLSIPVTYFGTWVAFGLCVPSLGSLIGASVATCITQSHNPKSRRAILSLDGPTPESRSRSFCATLGNQTLNNADTCLQDTLRAACNANNGTLDLKKVLVPTLPMAS